MMSRKKIKVMAVLFAVGVSLLFSIQARQESAKSLFEAGLFAEETKGDLEMAIKIFTRIIEDFSGDRETAALSQYHIGLCYEKLGLQEAQKAFQRVLENYPDQADAVQLARHRLNLIDRTESHVRDVDTALMIHMIEADRMIDELASVSPDGRYVSFVDWDTGDLAVFDIQTGSKRRLTNKGSWTESNEMALESRWSPDGKQIAYIWFGKESRDLRIVALDDLTPGILVRSPYKDKEAIKGIDCCDWSPDGRQILALANRGDTKQILSVSVEDGSIKILKKLDGIQPANPRYSPDGRYIAYSGSRRQGNPKQDIFLLSADGDEERKLVSHPADDTFLGFLPDGKHFLFTSDRSGNRDVWAAAYSDEDKPGKAELVKSNIGIIAPLGVTRAGALCYIHLRSFFDIYSAEVDVENAMLLSPPKKLIRYFEGMNNWPDYSPDGKNLAYLSRRNIRQARRTPRAAGSFICVYSFENEEIKEIPTKLEVYGAPRWSPDGKNILIVGGYDEDSLGLYKVHMETGEATQLVGVRNGDATNSYEWSSDGDSIYFVRDNRKKKFCEIVKKNLDSGEEQKLYGEDEALDFMISLSPDGKRLAILDNAGRKQRELRVLPVSGGEPKKLHAFEQLTGHRISPFWSVDGKYVFFKNNRPTEKMSSEKEDKANSGWTWELHRIALADGESRCFELGVHLVFQPRFHPDGSHISFGSFGPIEDLDSRNGIWMMEHIIPIEQDKR